MAINISKLMTELKVEEFRIITGEETLSGATPLVVELGDIYMIQHVDACMAASATVIGDGITCLASNQYTATGQFTLTAVGATGNTEVNYFTLVTEVV